MKNQLHFWGKNQSKSAFFLLFEEKKQTEINYQYAT